MVDDHSFIYLIGAIGLLILLLLTIFGLIVYSGLFTAINVKTCKPPFGSIEVAYKYASGPYSGSSVMFTEIHALAPMLPNLGVYYDDPNKVESSKLRFIVGAILNDDKDPDKAADKDTRMKLIKHGYKLKTLPAVDNVVLTTFPLTSMVSTMIAIYRVYPKLGKYIEENKLCAYPAIEVYGDDLITFFMPLSKQEEFFTGECGNLKN